MVALKTTYKIKTAFSLKNPYTILSHEAIYLKKYLQYIYIKMGYKVLEKFDYD